MAGGGVAADPFGQLGRAGGGPAVKELLHAAVHEPQPRLQPQHGLTDDGEPEVAGLDQPGVYRADRDFVHPGSFDGDERKPAGRREVRCGPGVGAHGVPVLRPVCVPDQPARPGMADRADAVQVEHFAFEPAGREGQVRQRRQRRIACGHDAFEFDAAVRPAGQKQVHDPQPVAVVMGRHQGQPKTVGQEFLGLLREAIARNPVQH